jgi:hypothetical protein
MLPQGAKKIVMDGQVTATRRQFLQGINAANLPKTNLLLFPMRKPVYLYPLRCFMGVRHLKTRPNLSFSTKDRQCEKGWSGFLR